MKALEIKSSMLFDLVFANHFIMLLFFFLIIDLYFLILAATAQIVNLIAELVIPIGIPSKKTKSEIEIYPKIVEAKIRKCSI